MGTRLVIGALFTGIGIVVLALCYLGARDPRKPYWASETIMGSVLVPLVIGLIVMGPMLMFQALYTGLAELSARVLGVSAAIVLASVAIIVMLRLPKRLADFAALSETGAAAGSAPVTRQEAKKLVGQPG